MATGSDPNPKPTIPTYTVKTLQTATKAVTATADGWQHCWLAIGTIPSTHTSIVPSPRSQTPAVHQLPPEDRTQTQQIFLLQMRLQVHQHPPRAYAFRSHQVQPKNTVVETVSTTTLTQSLHERMS